jgi:hypothetical protein
MSDLYRKSCCAALVICCIAFAQAAPVPQDPYTSDREFTAANGIDTIVQKGLAAEGLTPARLCSDQVFIRRAHLDISGTLPPAWTVVAFLKSKDPAKRKNLIERLLVSDAADNYWALKWCDLLRVKSEFPINLWPNGVQAYAKWIHTSVKENKPYDQFVRELLTSSGSNFRVPPVNFYRAVQGEEAASLASAAALTFMGVRLEKWDEKKRQDLAAFFSRIAFKGTAEWKETIVCNDPSPSEAMRVVFPDGTTATIEPGQDPRRVFADWLIKPDNRWFARNIVNRAWSWFMGRGIIHQPDDIREDNPAVYPELLAYLESELVKADYDLRHLFRLIANSSTYQQSSIAAKPDSRNDSLFARYPVRRLEAEVLLDAICGLTGTQESYTSAVPEPFTFIPPTTGSVALTDGSITSQYLIMFGRPARDTGFEAERNNSVSDKQRLHMINSTHIRNKIEKGWRVRQIFRKAGKNKKKTIQQLYLMVLSRPPMQDEIRAAADYAKSIKSKGQAAIDLFWALINSKEFLYRH